MLDKKTIRKYLKKQPTFQQLIEAVNEGDTESCYYIIRSMGENMQLDDYNAQYGSCGISDKDYIYMLKQFIKVY